MANLYEIQQEITNCFDMETGEILDSNKLDALVMDRNNKIENIALFIKNLEADEKAYKEEKESFAKKERATKNKKERLKEYLQGFLDGAGFKSTKVTISYRKSKSVVVESIGLLPEEYLRFREIEANKVKIKEDLQAGIEVKGAYLVESKNIQIK